MTANCSLLVILEEEDVFADKSQPFLFAFSWFCLILTGVLFPAFYIYFLVNRRKYERLRKRNLFFFTTFYTGFAIVAVNFSLRGVFGVKNYPCDMYFLLGDFTVTFLFLGAIFRTMSLYLRINFNQKLLAYTHSMFTRGKLLLKPGKETFMSVQLNSNKSNVPNQGTVEELQPRIKQSSVKKIIQKVLFKVFCWKGHESLAGSLQLSFFLASNRFINVMYSFTCFFLLTYFISDHLKNYPIGSFCRGCTAKAVFTETLILFGGNGVIVIGLLFALRKHADPLGIKFEMSVIGISFILFNILFILPLTAIGAEDSNAGKWDYELLVALESCVYAWFITVYQVKQAKKAENSDEEYKVSLFEILSKERSRKAFSLFLAVHLSIENLYFYLAVKEWKLAFVDSSDSVNLEGAEAILNNYVLRSAPFSINISDISRQSLIDNVDTFLAENMFDNVQQEVFCLMESGAMLKFLNSKYYQALRNEVDLSTLEQ